MRSAEVRRTERAWLTRELARGRSGLDTAWVALVLLNLVAIAVWPSWDTVPFHLISTGFAVLYGLRLWPADPVLWGLGIVIITTFGGIPKVISGMNAPPAAALLADSGPATPSIAPWPNRSGVFDSRFSSA